MVSGAEGAAGGAGGPAVAVIGAGPAGLTAAYLLSKNKIPVTVFEADPHSVGGIARTVNYRGFRFDIGGHRFFSKAREVEALWREILPEDLLERPRSSRIYYNGKFFAYPLKPMEALHKLGVGNSALCLLSWLKARAFPVAAPDNFEDWVSNQFGRRLFSIFFKSYTEKVWGMDCRDISADWAAQRIQGLSLGKAIRNAFFPNGNGNGNGTGSRGGVIKTLIHSFRYPRWGPGMMWEACADKVRAQGGQIVMGARVTGCAYDAARRRWQVSDSQGGTLEVDHVISSAPIPHLVRGLSPSVSDEALQAAMSLRFRDFLTVAVILKDRHRFDDNWIYIHDPKVKVGRVQNYKSWSPEMVPDPEMACYGLEYFCFEGDGLWISRDETLLELAARELAQIGLAEPGEILDGCVVRQKKAYPVYDDDYAKHVDVVREEIAHRFPNLHLVGRNGMHKYNNQDHAMMTAMLCVKNILAGQEIYDLWAVNQDAQYHEIGEEPEGRGDGGARQVPRRRSGARPGKEL